ncbi:hypothetical protein DXG01_009780 [Tephrocybe rancida]|nr:hypothetical protein DXG01_009780 [Tephrocybe rancida]
MSVYKIVNVKYPERSLALSDDYARNAVYDLTPPTVFGWKGTWGDTPYQNWELMTKEDDEGATVTVFKNPISGRFLGDAYDCLTAVRQEGTFSFTWRLEKRDGGHVRLLMGDRPVHVTLNMEGNPTTMKLAETVDNEDESQWWTLVPIE